jgi:hypothetical protein
VACLPTFVQVVQVTRETLQGSGWRTIQVVEGETQLNKSVSKPSKSLSNVIIRSASALLWVYILIMMITFRCM